MRKVNMVLQTDRSDCGLACLSMVLDSLGNHVSIYDLKLRYPVSTNGISVRELVNIAKQNQCRTKAIHLDVADLTSLSEITNPIILFVKENHHVVLEDIKGDSYLIADPAMGKKKLSKQELESLWDGITIVFQQEECTRPRKNLSLTPYLRPLFKAIKGKWIAYTFTALLAIAINLLAPWLLGLVISSYVDDLKEPLIISEHYHSIAAIILLIIFSFWAKERLTLSIRLILDKLLTSEFIERIFSLPITVYLKFSTGDLLNRVSSTAILREFYTTNISALLLESLIVLTLFAALFYEHILLGTIVTLSAFLLVFALKLNWHSYKQKLRAEVLSNASNSDYLTDFLTGVDTIKSLKKEHVFYKRWKNNYSAFLNTSKLSNIQRINIGIVQTLFDRCVPAFILLTALFLHMSDNISQQQAFYCYFLVTWLAPSISNLFQIAISYIHLSIHTERLSDFNYERSSLTNDDRRYLCREGSYNSINVKGMSFSYTNDNAPIFDNVDLQFGKEGLHVLVGASGAGKSTLLKLIANQLEAVAGNIIITTDKSQSVKNAQVCYLSQTPYIFRGSIIDNLTMFESEKYSNEDVIKACTIAGIHHEILEFSHGYQTILQFNGQNISGGQRQRIALARVILLNPQILILDEATSQLDKAMEISVIEALRYRKGLTVIATHRTFWLQSDDFLYEIKDKQILLVSEQNKEAV